MAVKQKSLRFFIDLLGCEKRKLDAERILRYMEVNGHTQVTGEKDLRTADVVIFVSCAFDNEFDELSKNRVISLMNAKRDDAIFILAGCLPEIDPGFLSKQGIDYHVGPRDMSAIDQIIHGKVKLDEIPEQNLSYFDNRSYPVPDRDYRSVVFEDYVRSKNSYKIRVSWGCLSNCSFCVAKKATKSLQSKPFDDVRAEVEEGLENSQDAFFITGGDVGAYGQDIARSVVDLVRLLTSYKGIDIYIQEFNIQWIIKYADELAEVLLSNFDNYNKMFICTPIQSGSGDILRKMRRPYTREMVSEAIGKIRHRNPKLRIGSHFVVGFPGETLKDFEMTKDLVNSLDLDFMMVFLYSDHKGTDSHRLPDKVDPKVARERRIELLELQKRKDLQESRYSRPEDLSIDGIHRLSDEINGWLTPSEGEFLFTTAMSIESGNIVEIGSWMGKSTLYLSYGSIQGQKCRVYAVDHHTGSEEQRARSSEPIDTLDEFLGNLKRYNMSHVVSPVVSDSLSASKMIDDEISFIFIDGSHEYDDVKTDFEAWWPRLANGGSMAFHDTLSKPGVVKFIDEMLQERGDVINPRRVDEIVHFQKSPLISEKTTLKNQPLIKELDDARKRLDEVKGKKHVSN
ncbi:MAG: radical SAM protein [Methanomassiliicoccales archaeon]|nr:MAG: radical SAM protein [Methanomassiliicoccales archaeon]